MGGFLGPRDEVLAVGPSADRLLAALDRAIRAEDAEVIVQPAGPGPWTAYYHGRRLLVLARPSAVGPPGAVDVGVPGAGWARTLIDLSDAEDPEVPDAMRRAMGAGPGSAGSGPLILADESVGGIGAVIAVIAIVLVVADFVRGVIRRHNSDTAVAAAAGRNAVFVLRAARFEASIRESSLSIGCLGSTVAFFGLVLVVFAIASVLAPGGQLASLAALSVVGVLVISAWLFWWIRRRFPSPPPTRMDRWAGRAAVGVILLVVVAYAVVALQEQRTPLSAEQEAWCLGPGAGYVDNAVGVLSIPRTWTSESAKDDPNFRMACGVAWDATHR